MGFERYYQAVDYLQRRLWHELPIVPVERALQGRIREVLAHLGDPHVACPVLHVGGSAGKGSTASIAASILQSAGLRTGLYTSPHLQTFIERAAVDARLIAPDAFAGTVLSLEPLVRRMHAGVIDGAGFGRPSLVEVAFAAGMKHFADERCDAALVEVGLGGRTDCTNVFERKAVSVLTNIDFEHRERLGWTIESIAREKADIIKGGETVVTATTRRAALSLIEACCHERGAVLWRYGREITARITTADDAGSTFDLRTPAGSFDGLRLPLAGEHQVVNASLAVAATLAFGVATGREVTGDAVRCGLERVRISARLETVQREPRVVLDSAHNPAGARGLAAALRDHFLRDGGRLHLVLGILADKDQAAMVRALAPGATRVVVTRPPLAERAGDPGAMVKLLERRLGAARVTFEPSPMRALDIAIGDAAPRDVVCVTGSMFLAGAVRERWVPERDILTRRTADFIGGDSGDPAR